MANISSSRSFILDLIALEMEDLINLLYLQSPIYLLTAAFLQLAADHRDWLSVRGRRDTRYWLMAY